MQTVFLWPNYNKPNMEAVIVPCIQYLKHLGLSVLLPYEVKLLFAPMEGVSYAVQTDAVQACDWILSLGGDGTMLRIAELAALYQKPLLGMNLGHVGFMTELEYSELELLQKVVHQAYTVEERIMLSLQVIRQGMPLLEQTALNDVVIAKTNPFRVAELEIAADDVPVMRFRGDGAIVATPTGSTAYSLAAGGPVLDPSAENLSVTPVCAHDLRAKSFVFSPHRTIRVQASAEEGIGLCVAADGRSGVDVQPCDSIVIRKSEKTTRLIRVKGRSFYHLLYDKLSNRGA